MSTPRGPILSPPPPGAAFGSPAPPPAPAPRDDQADMAEAIERLAAALKREEEPDAETARQVREIQDQIAQMLDSEQLLSDDEFNDDDTASLTQSEYMEQQGAYMRREDGYPQPPPSSADGNARLGRYPYGPGDGVLATTRDGRGAPHTELPHYPTPWELWKKAHESTEQPREAPVLTEDEWEKLVERLNDSSKMRQISLMRKQHKHIAKELAGLNFKPRINPLSRDLASENLRLYEGNRLKHVVRAKAEKIRQARHELQMQEINMCTFRPNLTKKGRRKRRDTEDLMLYGEIKNQRMRQRRQYIQDQQDRELTFKPHVNRKSAMIVERMNREGRLRPTGGRRGYTGTNEDPGHGEDTFAPKINKRSRGLKLKGQVYDRLYESAKAKNLEHTALQEKYIADHIKGVTVSPLKMSRARGGGRITDLNARPQGPQNVVRYQPKHQFILARFGATVRG